MDEKHFIAFYTSAKRIECLLEEILFRQIAYNSLSQEEATEAFQAALKNVNKSMQEICPALNRFSLFLFLVLLVVAPKESFGPDQQ